MKKYVLLGFIALLALVLAVSPVMAGTTAVIDVNGTVIQTLSISNNLPKIDFGAFNQGMNERDGIGTLTVTSNFVPNWTVTAAMSDTYGFMRTGTDGATGPYLTNPLEEYNYQSAKWVGAHGFNFTGSASTTMLESFRQNVLITDAPGNYKTIITYTIAAV